MGADGARIVMEHGSGGALSRELVEDVIYPYLESDAYAELDDASTITLGTDGAFTTDTFVVDPLFFPGGDIGKLAVFGTCNDLSVSGAMPKYLSMGMVLEEGFPVSDLEKILQSMRDSAEEVGVRIVTGDTKVVPNGKGGGVYINTAGIGERRFEGRLSTQRIVPGDVIIVSAAPGAHGITILAVRENLKTGGGLSSDCANLYPLCSSLFNLGDGLKFMRDATRGGISAVLNEAVSSTGVGVLVQESAIPTDPAVSSVAGILGLNPLEVANEGVFVAVVSEKNADDALKALHRFDIGSRAAVIGTVTNEHAGRVVLETPIGGRRILDFPRGLLLPRIC